MSVMSVLLRTAVQSAASTARIDFEIFIDSEQVEILQCNRTDALDEWFDVEDMLRIKYISANNTWTAEILKESHQYAQGTTMTWNYSDWKTFVVTETYTYSSIDELFDYGTVRMDRVHWNWKQDDGTDEFTGAGWCRFNNAAVNKVYVNGNSWFGFGSSSEQLRVNRRDAASWDVWREEGTLYGEIRFLKFRWNGFSAYSATDESYRLTYDVVLFETGDICLHMVKVPTEAYNGTFNMLNVAYTAPTAANPYVTFYSTNEAHSSFRTEYSKIMLYPSVKYIISDGAVYYTISDGELVEIEAARELSKDVFLEYGISEADMDASLLLELEHPKLYSWNEYVVPTTGVVVTAIPPRQVVISDALPITDASITGIENVTSEYKGNPTCAFSFDGGETWEIWNDENYSWVTIVEDYTGMEMDVLPLITSTDWTRKCAGLDHIKVRFTLYTPEDEITNIVVHFTN